MLEKSEKVLKKCLIITLKYELKLMSITSKYEYNVLLKYCNSYCRHCVLKVHGTLANMNSRGYFSAFRTLWHQEKALKILNSVLKNSLKRLTIFKGIYN